MRLKSIYLSEYKNLKDFTLNLDSDGFLDLFVGKNGTGKSNLFEAVIEIFRHIVEFDQENGECNYKYRINYEIDGQETEIEWNSPGFSINGKERRKIGKTPLPDNILIYYSGHNNIITELVEKYEENFSKRIIRADFNESRYFIGIGTEYKELLLAILLIQPDECKAKQYIISKLGIQNLGLLKPGTTDRTEPVLKIIFRRPQYAQGSKSGEYDIENNDDGDRFWKPEGITKQFLNKLYKCIFQAPGELLLNEGYFDAEDQYILFFGIAQIQKQFSDLNSQDLFRQFDNLRTLGMIEEITIPIQLSTGQESNISHFSDGQFQSVYIYSIVELFKDRNCLTLLDEPDSFLHPEWQFEFLNQIFEITDNTVKNNHVLMSSHSAATMTPAKDSCINVFELKKNKIEMLKMTKGDVINMLSAGHVQFSEAEARLNINHVLKNTTGAVLFVEGITDEVILEIAFSKLYPDKQIFFEIQNAFGRICLRSMFSRDDLENDYPTRRMFALFDFDDAYDDWKGLWKKNCEHINLDPFTCLTKKHNDIEHYALLLPVPNIPLLKKQVLDSKDKPWKKGSDAHLSIELLFFQEKWFGDWFRKIPISGGGELIEFKGDKVNFARNIVPSLDESEFEIFRPMFDFIKVKCDEAVKHV